MNLKKTATGGIAAGMLLAGVVGTAALACSTSERSEVERSEANTDPYPWASQACLQQEKHRLWDSQISTSKGDNLQHNALMLRLCELEHRIEALQENLEGTEERR